MENERDILHRLFILVHHLKKGFQDFIALYDITQMEAKIIFYMDDEQIKVSDLITRFQKHKSTIRQKTRSLEKKGYISISHAYDDKRERIITLTKKGISFYKNLKKIEKKYHQNVFSGFDDTDKKQLINLLEKIEIERHENIC